MFCYKTKKLKRKKTKLIRVNDITLFDVSDGILISRRNRTIEVYYKKYEK